MRSQVLPVVTCSSWQKNFTVKSSEHVNVSRWNQKDGAKPRNIHPYEPEVGSGEYAVPTSQTVSRNASDFWLIDWLHMLYILCCVCTWYIFFCVAYKFVSSKSRFWCHMPTYTSFLKEGSSRCFDVFVLCLWSGTADMYKEPSWRSSGWVAVFCVFYEYGLVFGRD